VKWDSEKTIHGRTPVERISKFPGVFRLEKRMRGDRMAALTKEWIINSIYNQVGLSKSQSRIVVESLLEIMKQALENGEDVLVSGFGKFVVKDKSERRGRNPQTTADLQLRARRVVVFKTSGVLRERIN